MARPRIGVKIAAITVLIVTTGCEPLSNSAGSSNDYNTTADAAASYTAQNAAESIVPIMPPAPDRSTIEGRTEAAIIDQLSCRKPVQPAKAVNAMLRNGMLRETDDMGDGTIVYVPTKPLSVLGFPLVRVTGWQMMENSGDGVPPFVRAPGTPPSNFFEATVRASPQQVRSAIKAVGIREEGWRPDPAEISVEIDGKYYRPQRQIPGMKIVEGDMWKVEKKMKEVTTLSCTTDDLSFEP